MRRILALGAAALVLTGCGHRPAEPTLTVACRLERVEKPQFPFDTLEPGADIFTQTKTLHADRKVRQGYEAKLEAANKACQ
ncbi:hypothetical protein DMC25_06445 [Caulobacter sp. D4A]|uniref:hypothetical protein n=1 Tax=unclassified Caulobacter TaxID=2648921 RepID=UPI000D73D624|nr:MULTISPECIES: hypothetical protein [unclassified Caulobacter]PXA91189.1 hypothetical protein DMC25_06445 [Caulobacter sp. D4A]PXA96790.1 hypothetical protein DMC18_00575 [Caulobacter sp. D5]